MHSRAMVDINLSFKFQMVIVLKLLTRKNRKFSVYWDLNAMHDLLKFYDNFNKLLNYSIILQIYLKNVQIVLALNNTFIKVFCPSWKINFS